MTNWQIYCEKKKRLYCDQPVLRSVIATLHITAVAEQDRYVDCLNNAAGGDTGVVDMGQKFKVLGASIG